MLRTKGFFVNKSDNVYLSAWIEITCTVVAPTAIINSDL